MFTPLTAADILRQERRRVWEANACHVPAGSSSGGQFCAKGNPVAHAFLHDNMHRRSSGALKITPSKPKKLKLTARGAIQAYLSMAAQRAIASFY